MESPQQREIVEFLKGIEPFRSLPDAELAALAERIKIEDIAKHTVLLRQDGPVSKFFRIIKKGGVKVFIVVGETDEVVLDYKGEGDSFCYFALINPDKSLTNVVATEDTTCYSIPREIMAKFMTSSAEFAGFFVKSFFHKYVDRTFKEIRNKSLIFGGGEKLLITTSVGEIAARKVISAPEDITIKEAALLMSESRVSCLILNDSNGIPSGILTDRDLRDKVVAKSRDASDIAKNIMSVPLVKADSKETCFDALLRMMKYGIHHLLVVGDGRPVGIITNHDLMMLQGTSPISLVKEIEDQRTVEGLAPLGAKINRIIGLLIKDGSKASNITRILSEINDRLMRKVLDLGEKKFGPPPVRYCFIVFGSEGRKEQTFKTDQDNAIIYQDPVTDTEAEAAARYFHELAVFVRDALKKSGVPECPAGYMASNPEWTKPISAWKRYFGGWIANPTPEAVLRSLIFFDFRHLHGDTALADELRAHLLNTLKGRNLFFAHMAAATLKNTPPIGFFGSFKLERGGEHEHELNLKLRGIGPIVDIARLFALESGAAETSTIDRINALKDTHPVMREVGDEMIQAFEYITLLRIQHQFGRIQMGMQPDNFINPDKLNSLERKSLKEAFQLISKVQELLRDQYGPALVGTG